MFALLVLIWLGGFILEILSPTLAGKRFWSDFQFLGICFIPAARSALVESMEDGWIMLDARDRIKDRLILVRDITRRKTAEVEVCLIFIKAVKRALHLMNVFAHDMGIDFSRFYIGVSEKFLQNTDVNTMLKHMRGKGMTEGVDGGPLINTGF